MEATPTAPILESLSARQLEEESTAATGGLGEGERVALTMDGLAAVPEATARAAGSSGAEAGVSSDAPESGVAKLVAPKEQTAPPKVAQGMVGPTVRPRSPPSGASSYGRRAQGGRDRAC